MADIALTAAQIAPLDMTRNITVPAIASVALTAGQVCHYDATTGKAILSDASAIGTAIINGVCTRQAAAGQATELLVMGAIAGFTVSSLAYRAKVYLSDTAGAFADAAGTISLLGGFVIPKSDHSLTKVLYVFPTDMLQIALTAQETTITFTEPSTPDYALTDMTTTTPWGFADGDEARTFVGVVENLQVRMAELETMVLRNGGAA